MHRIINDIQIIIENVIKEKLPEVSSDSLEENGKVYYMNGKNGTEFDWFVNNHLPTFMVFYNDEKNLGAVKATVYTDGWIDLYLYDENGEPQIMGYTDKNKRFNDFYYGIRLSWLIPTYQRQPEEYYYY